MRGRDRPPGRGRATAGTRGRWRRGLRSDERALSTTVSHVLALALGAMLVGLLITSMSGFLTDETQSATREELESLGARLADDVAAASHLSRQGGNVTVHTNLPEHIVNDDYTVDIETGTACTTGRTTSDTCFVLESPSTGVTVVQPLSNSSAVRLRGEGSDLRINLTTSGSPAGDVVFPEPSIPATVGVGPITGGGGGPQVVVNKDPVAGFVFRPGSPTAGDNISFVNDTADLDGEIVSYEWTLQLPSGGNRTVSGPTANHTYDTPGRYKVTLEVTDDEGETDSISRRIPVSGLVYTGDSGEFTSDANADEGGVWFSLNNTWADQVELMTLGLDPRVDTGTVGELDNEEPKGSGIPELIFDVGSDIPEDVTAEDHDDVVIDDGYVDYDDEVPVPGDGFIADLDADGEYQGSNPLVDSGDNVTVYVAEFRDTSGDVDDASDHPMDVAVRYRVNESIYVSKFALFAFDTGDTLTWETEADWDAALAEANVTHPDDAVRLDAPGGGGGGVPENGLQVWLPLNETGNPADAIDYAGSTEYEFYVVGDPTTGVSGVDGGTAYEFHGSSWLYDYNAEDTYLENADELTISMWVKADSTGTNYGLVDTRNDEYDDDDDELGLRYDSSGWAGGGSNSFKASIAVNSGSYAYEYESDVQSTDWQHVVMRWEAGGEVELFVDGEKLTTRDSAGTTPPGAKFTDDDGDYWWNENEVFMGIGRSQKDDTDALWEGKIDEVRIYDRALDDGEVEALRTHGNLKQGFINTSWKTTSSDLDLTDLRLGYDTTRNGGTIRVTVLTKRDDGSVETADTLVLGGDSGVKEVKGLTGDADEFRLHIEFSGVSNTPSADSFTLGD